MGQTQFRSDDTVHWWMGFGDGSDGAYSSVGDATDSLVDSACSGTDGTFSLTATNASFAIGKPILIHQTRGTGAGKWELNQILSYTTGTITTVSPLKNTYTNSGASVAQVIQLKQYTTWTQNSGHTLTAKAWNGTVGGILPVLARVSVGGQGSLNLAGNNVSDTGHPGHLTGAVGVGFSGGNGYEGGTNGWATSGEGTAGDHATQSTANGNGGGAGYGGFNDVGGFGGGGAGVSNGSDGININGGTYGLGGVGAGVASCVTMNLGGGGGGSARRDYHPFGGGAGGGILIIICPTIDFSSMSSINLKGGYSLNSTIPGTTGGAGGSGVALLKGINVNVGSGKIDASANQDNQPGYAYGGAGIVHVDYHTSISGTTLPTINTTQDTTLNQPIRRTMMV